LLTVWDPMHDGVDNDGDGSVDEADTGRQAGDLWGPEVRVYGVIDVNHTSVRAFQTLMPEYRHPSSYLINTYGQNRERSHAVHVNESWVCYGPRESIGDLLRLDDLRSSPGDAMGGFGWAPSDYVSSVNLVDVPGENWGWGPYRGYDDDLDGIVDERDERDFWFTQMANFMTTRDHTFTIEIVTELTDPPYYPGRKYYRGAYKVDTVHANKRLILMVDRSTTLRIDADGRCDFTGPMRVLARRWGHDRR
ncbi:MAG TPA: hypothetical protein VMX57_03215, partial [Planctomycetota bacterium]|nr:hypothetical protein [Planctomycetota bacterium]